jgi:hypothetical protein
MTDAGGSQPPSSSGLWEQEPFATMAAYPRRFGWGVPLVFLGALGVGIGAARWSLALGLALLLVLQTGGLLALYVPALRRRLRGEDPQ